ncbi:hypothetical protein [Rhodococcus sp. IEGM1428]|uniref:hypothetical protein n=1 Tax=Rhodococcus sp. IEGM1428 TaxID=3392191 RepID=UPI003D0C14FB
MTHYDSASEKAESSSETASDVDDQPELWLSIHQDELVGQALAELYEKAEADPDVRMQYLVIAELQRRTVATVAVLIDRLALQNRAMSYDDAMANARQILAMELAATIEERLEPLLNTVPDTLAVYQDLLDTCTRTQDKAVAALLVNHERGWDVYLRRLLTGEAGRPIAAQLAVQHMANFTPA